MTKEKIFQRGWKLHVDHAAACGFRVQETSVATSIALGGVRLLIKSVLMALDLFEHYRIFEIAMQNLKERTWKVLVLQVYIFE